MQAEAALSARVDEAHNVIEIPDSDDEQLLNDVDDLLQDNGSWTLDLLPAGQPDEATATAKNALIDLDDHDANRIDGAEAAFTGGLSSGVQLERRSTRSQSPASRQIEYEALLSSPDPLELGPLTAARTAPFSRPLRTASHSEGSPTRFVIAQQKDNQRRQAAEGKRSPQSAAVNAQLASSDDELPFIGQIPRLPVPSAVHRVDIAESSDSDTVEVTTMSARVANRRSAVTNTKSGSAVAAMPPAITEDSDGDLELPPVIQPVQTVSPTTGASPNSGLVDANPKLRVPEPVVSLIQSPSPPPLARGRSLRQRTAVQKQPYTMEFARFATAAVKNQWSGIVITDGLNTKDKAQHASDRPAKPKAIDTLGGWLVPEDGQVEQVVTQGDDDSGTYELQRASSEAAADGRAEKRKRSKVTNPSSGDMRSAERPKFVWNVAAADDASTSALTYEELVAIRDANAKHAARMAAGRDSRADFAVGRSRHGEDETVTRRSRSSSEPAPSTQQSRSARSAPSRKKRRTKITSSSSRHGQPRSQEAHGGKVFDVQTSDEDRSHAAGSEAFDVDSSDSDSQGGGESPERPAAAEMPEDRFKLTGKRKRAIKGMMPNSWIKKAERDLRAMREEKKHGKRVREVVDVDSADDDDENDTTNDAGRARVRRNADLADRPMRFAIDISSDEALSSQNEAEDDEAHQQLELQEASMTWADQNHSNRKSNTAYWDGVIDRIFVRQKRGTGAGKRRQAVKQREPQLTLPHTTGKASHGDFASPKTPHAQDQLQRKRKPKRQQRLHFVKTAVQLDTEAAIFSELRGPKADIDNSRGVPQAADSAAPLVPNIASRADDLTTFSRFTFDYGLDRLPAGLRFAQETYIARGHLRNLLGPTVAGAAIEDRRSSCRSFGISLDHDMRIADFIDFFPLICDNIVNAVSADGYQPNLHDEVCEVMRFTSSFMMDCDAQDEVARVQTALDEIDSRLLLWKLSTNASETSVAHATLVWRWCQLEYALRMHGKCRSRRDESRPPQIAGDITDAVTALLECLLTIGLHRVTQTLRTASESADAILDDVICEVWVALLHVTSLEHRHTAFTQDYLWKGVIGQLQQHARQHGIHPVLRGEIASHAACALSALSQFTQTGLCIGQPSISPFWPIVLDIIDTIKPQELNAAYVNMDNVGKTRASRYIWCIFARCLVLSSRWNWPVLEQSKLFGRLFDIFNARELQDFSIDGEAAFPAFLAAYNGHIDDKPGHSDSVFVLFLRLIAKAGSECVADGSDRARTMLNRVLMRVTPMRERLPFLQNQPALSKRKHRSSLVNHYALLLVLMTLDSASTAKRLTRMQNLLAFEEADFAARQECLKAICYSGTVLMHTGQPFDALLAWVTTLAERLRAAYLPLAKERLSLVVPLREKSLPSHVAANNANKPAILDRTAHLARINLQMSQYAVLLAAIMSCVRGFILEQSKRSPATYPSLNLLHTAWTVDILDTCLARDPIVGPHALQLLQAFVEARAEALRRADAATNRESQDDYGDADFDYDDPALNALLGIPTNTAAAQRHATKHPEADRYDDHDFAELVMSKFSHLLYRLLSDVCMTSFSQSTGVPEISDKPAFITLLTQVWAGCVAAPIKCNMRDWTYYMSEFGKESWHRVNLAYRYHVGAVFSVAALHADVKFWEISSQALVELAFRTAVVPQAASAHCALLSAVLDACDGYPLWHNHPYIHIQQNGKTAIDEREVQMHRQSFWQVVFRNSKAITTGLPPVNVQGETVSAHDFQRSLIRHKIDAAVVHRWLGCMLASMRDTLDNLKGQHDLTRLGAARQWCQTLLHLIQSEIGPLYVNERTVPQMRLVSGLANGAYM